MSDTAESRIRALPCWHGPITLEPLKGGLSNVSFRVVEEGGRKAVARVGEDFPFHHVSRTGKPRPAAPLMRPACRLASS